MHRALSHPTRRMTEQADGRQPGNPRSPETLVKKCRSTSAVTPASFAFPQTRSSTRKLRKLRKLRKRRLSRSLSAGELTIASKNTARSRSDRRRVSSTRNPSRSSRRRRSVFAGIAMVTSGHLCFNSFHHWPAVPKMWRISSPGRLRGEAPANLRYVPRVSRLRTVLSCQAPPPPVQMPQPSGPRLDAQAALALLPCRNHGRMPRPATSPPKNR